MTKSTRLCIIAICLLCFTQSFSQTSWTGTVSTSWSLAGNWTSGVPTVSQNAIIGDASFTGLFQPTVAANAACANLTIGGAVPSILTVNKLLTVSGNLMLNSNGTLSQGNTNIVVGGNWTNSGTYSATGSGSPVPTVVFAGTAQSIAGANSTSFRNLTVNPGSVFLLSINIDVTGILTVGGTVNPAESPTYQISGGGSLTVIPSGLVKVNASTFSGNYNLLVMLLMS